MSLRLRFSIVLVATALTACTGAVCSLWALAGMHTALVELNVGYERQSHTEGMKREFLQGAGELTAFLSADRRPETRERYEAFRERFEESLALVRSHVVTQAEEELIGEVEEHWRRFGQMSERILFLAKRGDRETAERRSREIVVQQLYPRLGDDLDRLLTIQEDRHREAYERAMLLRSRATTWIIVGFLLLIVATGSGFFLVWNQVVAPLKKLGSATREIAQGRPEPDLGIARSDEIGVLAREIEQMSRAIHDAQSRLVERETFAAVGELTGTVAHNIRNPLASIRALAQGLSRDEPVDEESRATLKTIMETVDRADRWLRTLMEAMRPVPILPQVREARPFLEELVMDSNAIASRRGVVVELGDLNGIPAVPLDDRRMHQALFSVVMNAVEASPDGETVTITARGCDSPVRHLEIVVEDRGAGMDQEKQKKIFAPGFGEKASGTGLGLSLTRRIILSHKGKIEVESEPGKGTRMIVRLPASESEN